MWAIVASALIAASPVPTSAPAPEVSRCELGTTQRVSFSVHNAPKGAIASVIRISLFGKAGTWLADEVTFAGIEAPILRVAGLLNPRDVVKVKCFYEGYVDSMDQRGIVEVGRSTAGRKSCTQRDGLIVDGGPDAEVDSILFGRDWIMVQLGLEINHFLPNQETDFNGDVFAASIDGGPLQKVVVSGRESQTLSFLFTDLHPGLHQINYGPRNVFDAVSEGGPGYSPDSHNLCIKI